MKLSENMWARYELKNAGYLKEYWVCKLIDYDHMKGCFDNHSCYELFRKLTMGNFFRLPIHTKYLWKGSFFEPETSRKCELHHIYFSKISTFLHFYGTLHRGCFWNFTILIRGALCWLNGFCTPETAGNVFVGISVIIMRAHNINLVYRMLFLLFTIQSFY